MKTYWACERERERVCVCVCVCDLVEWREGPYLGLNQLHSLGPQVLEVMEDTQSSLHLHLLHGQVQKDECPSSPHPGTAVDKEGCGQRGGVLLADTTDERDERHGIARDSMIRPGGVEHVGDCSLLLWIKCLQK